MPRPLHSINQPEPPYDFFGRRVGAGWGEAVGLELYQREWLNRIAPEPPEPTIRNRVLEAALRQLMPMVEQHVRTSIRVAERRDERYPYGEPYVRVEVPAFTANVIIEPR